MLSQHAKAVIEAFNRGYRVINGKLYNSLGDELATYIYGVVIEDNQPIILLELRLIKNE